MVVATPTNCSLYSLFAIMLMLQIFILVYSLGTTKCGAGGWLQMKYWPDCERRGNNSIRKQWKRETGESYSWHVRHHFSCCSNFWAAAFSQKLLMSDHPLSPFVNFLLILHWLRISFFVWCESPRVRINENSEGKSRPKPIVWYMTANQPLITDRTRTWGSFVLNIKVYIFILISDNTSIVCNMIFLDLAKKGPP